MIEPIKVKDLLKIFKSSEDGQQKNETVVLDALKEAIEKAYVVKQLDARDVVARVVIDDKYIRLFHDLLVIEEESQYPELEISLKEAQKMNPEVKLGEYVSFEVDIKTLNRSAVTYAKSLLKQKVQEYEKQVVYDEYIDLKGELTFGLIESVEEKFVIINLGKTLALMPKTQQIPNEIYREGERIRILITDVKKETKGARVLVSRADAMLVKRLFEKEVPEIFQGSVEIKAIARDAGERTKMAVFSKDENIDPIGACIGPRGSRVQVIIEELKGEKIDVFQWSEDVSKLIKNAFAPASIIGCFYGDDKKNIVVVVEDNQLSLAIGKKGKNAKLAVKLTGHKIEIKTKTEIKESGIDYISKSLEFEEIQAQKIKEKEEKKMKALQEEMAKKKEAILEIEEDDPFLIDSDGDVFENEEPVIAEDEEVSLDVQEETVLTEEVNEVRDITKKIKVRKNTVKEEKEELKPRTTYVSKFEEIADVSNKKVEQNKKKKRKKDDDERKLRPSELDRSKEYDFKVEYSDDELYEIEALEEEFEANSWIEDDEIDFDEYDSYYDEDLK